MLKYRMNATILNRWVAPGKKTDGAGLFWVRNKNGSISAWQRVRGKDVKIDSFSGKLTVESLERVRQYT